MQPFEKIAETVKIVKKKADVLPKIGLVLGSGLGRLTEEFEAGASLDYDSLPHFPRPTAAGHAGRLVFGEWNGIRLAALRGRAHLYEGHDPETIAFPIRVLAALGVKLLLLTNAAGGIREDLAPGDLLLISDHINLSGQNPLVGKNDERIGPRFPDMTQTYDPIPREILLRAAGEEGMRLTEGVYASMLGPSFETPAEVRALGILGADAVGMSLAPEAVLGAHAGLRIAALSCITNKAAGLSPEKLSHEQTLAVANRCVDDLTRLLKRALLRLEEEVR